MNDNNELENINGVPACEQSVQELFECHTAMSLQCKDMLDAAKLVAMMRSTWRQTLQSAHDEFWGANVGIPTNLVYDLYADFDPDMDASVRVRCVFQRVLTPRDMEQFLDWLAASAVPTCIQTWYYCITVRRAGFWRIEDGKAYEWYCPEEDFPDVDNTQIDEFGHELETNQRDEIGDLIDEMKISEDPEFDTHKSWHYLHERKLRLPIGFTQETV